MEKLGSIWVDTASLIIGDPCQLLADGNRQALTYEGLTSLLFPGKPPETEERIEALFAKAGPLTVPEAKELMDLVKAPVQKKAVQLPNYGPICYMTGTDGYYPVYLEHDAIGQPRRIVIELGGKVDP